jgi:16S rRNA (guanine966-N2)-methyltransferase
VRIVAGTHRGHTIYAPPGRDTRPTSDRVRENVFNILGPVDDASVLDLYAGSGAMGLEALSRGAARAVFVDRATILRQDALTALAAEAAAGRKYDLVLVDPPYDMYADIQPKLSTLVPRVLSDDGVVVVETSSRVEPELPLELRTTRVYGQTRVTVYER